MPAWSLPAIPAPALAFSARRHGAEKLSKSGHRIRQQAVCISVGSTRLLAQPPIGSPMHAPRLLRKRFQRVGAPAEPHLDLLRSAHCPFYGNLLLARVHQPQAVPAGEQVACPVKLCNAPATKFPASRDLATLSRKRIDALPNLPTMSEAGYKDIEHEVWSGLFAPAKTPKETISQLASWFTAAAQVPEVKAKLVKQGFYPVGICGTDFSNFVRKQSDEYGRAIRELNFKVK